MATVFYPRSAAPTTDPGAFTIDGVSFTGTQKALSLTRGGSAVSQADATFAGKGVGSEVCAWGSLTQEFPNGLAFISEPLNGVTLSGNVTANIRGSESNAMASYGVGFRLYHKSSGTGDLTQAGSSGLDSNELGTSEAARTAATVVPGGAVLADGERLVILLEWGAAGGTTASGYTATGFYNGLAGATGDTFITFAETITEQSAAAANPPYTNQMAQLIAQ
jgi:hypothetical protein